MKFFILLAFYPLFSVGQSLSIERVKKIKASTVRVMVSDGSSIGTGFFINSRGDLATCWHVINPAITTDGRVKKIYIEFNNKDTITVVINSLFNNIEHYKNAFGYDYCILSPTSLIKNQFSFLKIGNFKNVDEGQEVYTCGYPLGDPNQFISKGIISTKYENKDNIIALNGDTILLPRSEALLDMTLNAGNSGGAIVKIGETLDKDEVIGIADFGVNPLGKYADTIIKAAIPAIGNNIIGGSWENGNMVSGFDPSLVAVRFADAISKLSIGVSGCISIDYLQAFLKDLGMGGNGQH